MIKNYGMVSMLNVEIFPESIIKIFNELGWDKTGIHKLLKVAYEDAKSGKMTPEAELVYGENSYFAGETIYSLVQEKYDTYKVKLRLLAYIDEVNNLAV